MVRPKWWILYAIQRTMSVPVMKYKLFQYTQDTNPSSLLRKYLLMTWFSCQLTGAVAKKNLRSSINLNDASTEFTVWSEGLFDLYDEGTSSKTTSFPVSAMSSECDLVL
ncbi:hypothetical protein OGAPHI_005500 [Ogataea philodendri]|uniref:Uncharacterized protein n=1 Tax=Ogataea philodendri TaxID=1378263 RepID=A0A9P8NZ55_9ASCO|nr:uncharacterized protein OGAPHI_005500 [Ogataea philodendri]KAH3662252.1 hypothetical protein OGAPHI_005500 [Ogataea philodendri]